MPELAPSEFMLTSPAWESHQRFLRSQVARQMEAMQRSLTVDQARNTADLESGYPTLPRDLVIGAGMLGLTTGSESMQTIALRNYAAEAQVEADQLTGPNWFQRNVLNRVWGGLKAVTRAGFTVFDMMWNEGLARPFKTVVATLGLADNHHAFGDPVHAWRDAGTSYGGRSLAQLVRGDFSNIDQGSGFIPRSEGTLRVQELMEQGLTQERAETQAHQELGAGSWWSSETSRQPEEQLTMGGLGISPGRTAAMPLVALDRLIPGGTFIEPGSLAFNLISGTLDAAVMMGTMRLGRIPGRIPETFGARAIAPLRGKNIPLIGGRSVLGLPEKGLHVPILGDPMATLLKHISVVRRARGGLAPSQLSKTAEQAAFATEMSEKGIGPFYSALIRGARSTVHTPSAVEAVDGPLGRRFTEFVDEHVTPENMSILVDWFRGKRINLPLSVYRDLAQSGKGGNPLLKARDVLVKAVDEGHLKAAPWVVGQLSPLQGRLSRQLGRVAAVGAEHGAARALTSELGYLGGWKAGRRMSMQSYGWGRLFSTMGKHILDVEHPAEGFHTLNDWMVSAGIDYRRRSLLLSRWASQVKGDTGMTAAQDITDQAFRMFAKDLEDAGVPSPVRDYVTRTFRETVETRKYPVDQAGDPIWGPGSHFRIHTTKKGSRMLAPTPGVEAEFMNRGIAMPDGREMRHAMSTLRRFLYFGKDETGQAISRMEPDSRLARWWLGTSKQGGVKGMPLNENAVNRYLDWYMGSVWKPMTLLRVAWPIRVIGEEQLRMAAAGYSSVFRHPVQWLTWAITDPKANWFTKTLDWWGIRPRGRILSDIDPGEWDPQIIDRAVDAARQGDTAEAAAVHMRAAGFDIDPTSLDDVAAVQRLRDSGQIGEDLLLTGAREYQAGMSSMGDLFLGHERNPISGQVWGMLDPSQEGFWESWSRELLQLRGSTVARRFVLNGEQDTVRWLRSPDGRRWIDDTASRMQDQAAARRFRDPAAIPFMVKHTKARMWEKMGGRSQLTIDGEDVGRVFTEEQAHILESPSEWHRVDFRYEGDINPDLAEMVKTGRWGEHSLDHPTRKGLKAFENDLRTRFKDVAPEQVKGPVGGPASKVFGDSWDRTVRRLFDMLMTAPTNALSRSPVFRQDFWRWATEAVDHASPQVHASILQAAKNADLGPSMIRDLEMRIARAQATPGYGVLSQEIAGRADRIVRMQSMSDADLVQTVARSRLLADLDAADPKDVDAWWHARLTGADDLDDGDLAMRVLGERHQDEYGRITGQIMDQLNGHMAATLGVDMTPKAVGLRAVRDEIAAGRTVDEIATARGVKPATVQRWLKEAERGTTPEFDILERRLDQLWDLYGAERAHSILGHHFDLYTDTVNGVRQARAPYGITSWDDYEALAKAHALQTVQDLLYDAHKKHGIMDVMRNVFPFGEAWVEVLTTWMKLMVENPQLLRRGQQLIEGGRQPVEGEDPLAFLGRRSGQGFLFTDPSTGAEVFNYPGAGLLFNAAGKKGVAAGVGAGVGAAVGATAGTVGAGPVGGMLGGSLGGLAGGGLAGLTANPVGGMLGGEQGGKNVGFRMQAELSNLNLLTGSVLPGFGPVVQTLFSQLTAGNPTWDYARGLITPFGDASVKTVGDLADLVLPRWATRLMGAVGVQTPEQKRLFSYTVMDVYKTLILTRGEPEDQAQANLWLEEAKQHARKLSLYRAFASIFSPAAPEMRFEVEDRRGKLWLFQTLATEYTQILNQECGGDDVRAYDLFVRRFGLDPTIFATAKSVQISPRSMQTQGDRWGRENADLFDLAPATAYFAHPDDPSDDSFEYSAYVRQLEEGARVGLTPEQWMFKRNDTIGRILYEKARREFDASMGPKQSTQKTIMQRMIRQWLIIRYPGYRQPNPGVPQTYDTEQRLREIREQWFGQTGTAYWADGSVRWEGDGSGGDMRLRDSETGKALWAWLQAVDAMTARTVDDGLTAGGLWSAEAAWPYRETLRRYAARLMSRYPDFQYVYRLVLEHQMPDSDMQLQALMSAGSAG